MPCGEVLDRDQRAGRSRTDRRTIAYRRRRSLCGGKRRAESDLQTAGACVKKTEQMGEFIE